MKEKTAYSHGRVAWCYEAIASTWSLGAIARTKASQIELLNEGERVLYAGVGAGEDALLAARSGVTLTCVDVSPLMLKRLERRLQRRGLTADLVACDILEHAPAEPYDVVIANFVLNLYGEALVRRVLQHLRSLLGEGGRLLIADFAPPETGRWRRLAHAAYYRPINLAAWGLGLCALHPVYDYTRYFEGLGMQLEDCRQVRPFGRGPAFFQALEARATRPAPG
jgi:ubiquinone/menaquinone biosynthesis C-methylase UbiE